MDCGGPGAKTIFDCLGLKRLHIRGYRHKTSPTLEFSSLQTLRIDDSSIASIPQFRYPDTLTTLWLGMCHKFDAVDSISQFRNLAELRIDDCPRLGSVAPLAHLTKLTVLDLTDDGDIQSLKPLDGHPRLEAIFIDGSSKIVDGDLTPLMTMASLQTVKFAEHKHYTHTMADFVSKSPNK